MDLEDTAIGVGAIFGQFLSGALRNPSAADGQFGRAFIGAALAENGRVIVTGCMGAEPDAISQRFPDVLAITGDHSTPCAVKGHSWHPQPVLLQSAYSGSDKLTRFTETGANQGSLGIFEAKYLIRLMQANAKMFDKFGA
mgnify:CR=1 FL=1